jgi:hypothetical protein
MKAGQAAGTAFVMLPGTFETNHALGGQKVQPVNASSQVFEATNPEEPCASTVRMLQAAMCSWNHAEHSIALLAIL